MDITLIRHTEVAVGRAVCYGQSDVALADTYAAQYDRLLAHLPPHPDVVFSSPLSRCHRLALDLANGRPLRLDDRLKEFHFGDWEGLPWSAIPREALDPWMADFVNVRVPNGETFSELYARTSAFWHDSVLPLAAGDAPPSVLIVTHGGVIRALLCLFLGLSLQHAYRIQLDYGSATKLTTNGSFYTIQYINR